MKAYDRTLHLKPDFEMREHPVEYGRHPFNRVTGEFCEPHTMKWNPQGTLLLCTKCGIDGT